MKEIPERLICQATLNGMPVEGIMIYAGFGVEEKNSYGFIFGPTNHDGCVVITKDEVLKQAKATMYLAMMDYIPLDGGFSGEISLKAMGVDRITDAIAGYELYNGHFPFPPDYLHNLELALSSPLTQKAEQIKIKCLI